LCFLEPIQEVWNHDQHLAWSSGAAWGGSWRGRKNAATVSE
jgi:hypothetical protein